MMLRSWKFWSVWGAILGLIALLAYGFTTDPKKVPSPLLGRTAPDFEIKNLFGEETLKLSNLRGKPVILNFWASWCFECRNEAHTLEQFYQQYDVVRQEVHVVGIAIQDTVERSQAFARKFGKTYFLGLDNETGAISLDYGIYGVPETFFIDAQGVIRYKQVGGVTLKLLEEQLQHLKNTTNTEPHSS